ncbi:topoisomerase IA [Methanomethylovorans hollandica DSM 15978]|uniref:DNA topoisomerase n=2 Tax=Methanomethylovorans hollandica TaxID=101192 RepID=L0KXX3_METHD|nr:topoisomerase IA [Methanomethylovorans hollandica DSM 15978]
MYRARFLQGAGYIMTVVVFTEKNKAASQIANILSGGKPDRKLVEGVPVYMFRRNGQEWQVMGLSGHIMGYDFPQELNNWRSVDPAILIDTRPIKTVTKKPFADAIISLAREADAIILACDFDREGENIGFEAKELASRVSRAPVKRARFSSLSDSEIIKAFDNPVEPDAAMAMSAEARQILDLKMGAAFTRYLTLAVRERARTKEILSIGPCQTPTCGFVYERDKAIKEFNPEDFWKIEALFHAKDMDFKGVHRAGNIKDKAKAAEIFDRIRAGKTGLVTKKSVTEIKTNAPYPLNTTEFLKRASKFLNISPESALEIAEQLYLNGFTSYPRTETNKYADDFDFKSKVIAFTSTEYRDHALAILSGGDIVVRNGIKDGHDHPPIHPIKAVAVKEVEKAVKTEGAGKIYDLIARHFLANLMPAALFEKTHLEITVEKELFDSSGSIMKNEGWMVVYPFETKNDKLLPDIKEQDEVKVKKLENIASKTTPPKHLTEAELLTLMDKHGIGTKATAPSHIETNKKRGYFETKGKTIVIQETGFILMDALSTSIPVVVKPEIRASIESLVQEVEDGSKDLEHAVAEGTELIKMMYSRLTESRDSIVSRLAGSINDGTATDDKKNYIGKCPDCGRVLRIISTEKGRFVGCTGYPQCRNSYPLPREGALSVLRSKNCKKGGAAVIKVGNKYCWAVGIGPCFACDLMKKCFPPEVVGPCPICDGEMCLVTTKDSRFLGCSNRCGRTQSLPQEGRLTVLERKCEVCGWKMIRIKEKDKEAIEKCVNRSCGKDQGKKRLST